MALTTGTRLGPYEILDAIGAGGMGEVYRASDTRLKREVALKVLPDAFASDPERMARFQREAEVLASLNHPHIAHIYGVEERALVMELVEGPTLQEMIGQSSGLRDKDSGQGLPIDEALAIARQMADALDAAHEKGIVHRDLKPANVKVRLDGTVKILDFGLAKAIDPNPASSTSAGMMNSPTITSPAMMTGVGVILGTAAYMAPEQAKGRAVDKRADIWAFGCVLYEMLTGRRAFEGEDISDTLAFILTKEPEWSALPPRTPAILTRLLRRCLEKDPRRRLRDIGEARIAIDEAISGAPQDAAAVAPVAPTASARRPWIWMAATVVFALAVPAAWFLKPVPQPDQPLLQIDIAIPEGLTLLRSSVKELKLSPDGRRLVFPATGKDGKQMLWLRSLDANIAVPLFGTENAEMPFWSPDSQWVAFGANGKLQKIKVTGGQPQVICNGTDDQGGTWSSKGVILFADRAKAVIQRVSDGGGVPVEIGLDKTLEETDQNMPEFLPDGEHFLYGSNGKERGLAVFASLDGKTRRYLFTNGNSPPSYAPNPIGGGWLLYILRNQLFARPFDAQAGTFTGDAALVADGLANGPTWSNSTSGLLVYQRPPSAQVQMTWMSRDGKRLGTVGAPGDISSRRISPDGSRIAFATTDQQNQDIYVWDSARGNSERLTFEPGRDGFPIWTPDGRIVYSTERGQERLVVQRSPSTMTAETIVLKRQVNYGMLPSSLARNGLVLALAEGGGGTSNVELVSLPDGKALLLEKGAANPAVSPDGRWLIYTEGVAEGFFARAVPIDGQSPTAIARKQLSSARGTRPVWRGDGKEFFYIDRSDARTMKMMSVRVDAGPDWFRADTPQVLFQMPGANTDYDVTADGQKFLVSEPVSGTGEPPVTVIVNWPKLLQK